MIITESDLKKLKNADNDITEVMNSYKGTADFNTDCKNLTAAKKELNKVITRNEMIADSRFTTDGVTYCKYGDGKCYKITASPATEIRQEISDIEYVNAQAKYLLLQKNSTSERR